MPDTYREYDKVGNVVVPEAINLEKTVRHNNGLERNLG
jgi:hypothetical protein